MDIDSYIAPFVKAGAKVLRETLGFRLDNGASENEGDSFKSRGFTVIVGFTGGWKGRFIIDMSGETAMQMASNLTGETYHQAGDEEVMMSGAEIANIISGNAISEINNVYSGLNIRLTPPSVFSGDDINLFNIKLNSWSVLFNTDAGPIKINLAVEKGK